MKRRLISFAFSAMLCAAQVNAAEFAGIDDIAGPPGRTLENFFTAALNYSPTLTIARERWSIGTARKDAANGQLLPQMSATGTVSENEQIRMGQPAQDFNGSRYSLQVSQVLFNWQAFATRSQAYLLEDQAEAEYYAQLAAVLTDVADKYLSVLQAEDALKSLDSELDAMTNQVNQLQSLFDRQLVSVTNLYDAQARQARIQAERVTAESQLSLSREALRASSGLEVGNLSRLPENFEVPSLQEDLAIWLERTRNNNRLIEARTFALESANKRISRERGAFMPTVSLVMQKQVSNLGFQNDFIDETETKYIGINVTVPIFAGGSNRAAVREAYSMRNIAESELRQVQLEAIENTRTAYLQARAGESQIEAAQVLAQSTSTSYTAMQRGFELGTVTSVDMLNALRDQFLAGRQLQRARYDHLRATLVLRREAGTLTAEDLLDMSGLLNDSTTP